LKEYFFNNKRDKNKREENNNRPTIKSVIASLFITENFLNSEITANVIKKEIKPVKIPIDKPMILF
jgi:hypothetical protein